MSRPGFAAMLHVSDRLALRIVALLSVALLPLAIMAMVASLETRRTDQRSAERALVSLTAESDSGLRALVESAFTTAQTLARPTLERLDDIDACRELMADTVRRAGVFSFAGFIETDGMMRCASSGEPQDFSGSAMFAAMMQDPRPVVRRSESGAISGRPVLIASQPVIEDGRLRGVLSVSIALPTMEWLSPGQDAAEGLQPVLFNRMGELIAPGANDEKDPAALLPEGVAAADLQYGPQLFEGHTEGGKPAVFTVAELVRGQLYVLGVWSPDAAPAAALSGGTRWALGLPLLMWLASIGIVYVALDLLVTRHLRHIGRQMRRFALGDRTPPAPLPQGSAHELREVQATFSKMAALVARDEAELSEALKAKEAALAEKTVLLKEVHHRVKNNLQLIASILNLQMRRLDDARSRRVLQSVQDRVIGLAAIHRSLYQSDRLSELRADLLLDEVLRHLFAVGTEAGSGIDLKVDLAPVTLEADQLVPLSLLLTEGVTNALKHLGQPPGGGRPWLTVRLAEEAGEVVLTLGNSLGPRPDAAPEAAEPSTRLGTELIDAFAAQLGAVLEQGADEAAADPGWQMSVRFPRDGATEPEPEPEADPEPREVPAGAA